MKVQQVDKELHKPASAVPFLPVFIIAVVAFGVYFNTLFNGFVYDDNGQILGNPWIKDVEHLPEIFYKSVWSFMSAPSVSNYYRPMMHLIYMVNYHIFGLKPWGFHLVNVLFHAANTVLVFLVASRLFEWPVTQASLPSEVKSNPSCPPFKVRGGEEGVMPAGDSGSVRKGIMAAFFSSLFTSNDSRFFAFIAALLFATHPIHTEAVAWAGAITDLSFTFFSLLSIHFYMKTTEDLTDGHAEMAEGVSRYRNYALSIVFFSLAVLCKEPALTLPGILMAYDFSLRRGSLQKYVIRYTPYVIVACIYLALRFNALGSFSPVKVHGELAPYQLVINIFPLFVAYLQKLLLPVDLNAFHVLHPIASLLELKGIIALIVTAAYAAITVIAYRKNRTAFLCLMLIFIPLLPVFYIPALGESAFAERYLYLPSAGFVVLLVMSLAWLQKKMAQYGLAIILGAVSLAGLYSFQTITRNPVWKDDLTLFADTVKKSPDGELPNGMLGIALMGAGRFDEAVEQFRKTLKLNPNSPNAHYNLGLTLLKKGLPAEAIPEFQKALALTPDDLDARRYLAEANAKTGMTDKTGEPYRVLEKSGQNPPATYVELGIGLAKEGRLSEAVEQYKKALAIDPDYVDAHYNLGAVYANSGNIDKAIEHLRRAVALQPGNAFYRNMLGIAYGQKGMNNEAVEQFREAVRLAPGEPAYRKNLKRAEGLKGPAGKN